MHIEFRGRLKYSTRISKNKSHLYISGNLSDFFTKVETKGDMKEGAPKFSSALESNLQRANNYSGKNCSIRVTTSLPYNRFNITFIINATADAKVLYEAYAIIERFLKHETTSSIGLGEALEAIVPRLISAVDRDVAILLSSLQSPASPSTLAGHHIDQQLGDNARPLPTSSFFLSPFPSHSPLSLQSITKRDWNDWDKPLPPPPGPSSFRHSARLHNRQAHRHDPMSRRRDDESLSRR